MVQQFVKDLISQASEEKVHDIYILPYLDSYRIFFRRSEERSLIEELGGKKAEAVIAHLKFYAGMNVGEKRRTQLGACDYQLDELSHRLIRLSTVGDVGGQESLVIRLLRDKRQDLQFWKEGANTAQLVRRRGLYLFSGPVASGKTSLMYELAKNNFKDKQIITIEDPVEIIEEDFLQLQLNEMIGNDYEELIKLSLRHHPDLLIVGEIRDLKTAKAVIRASLTGFTVFSTIHAKSIKGVNSRLLEFGITKEEIDNSLQGIFSQRLLGGKALVDYAKGNGEDYKIDSWNQKLEGLFKSGHISQLEFEREKISLS